MGVTAFHPSGPWLRRLGRPLKRRCLAMKSPKIALSIHTKPMGLGESWESSFLCLYTLGSFRNTFTPFYDPHVSENSITTYIVCECLACLVFFLHEGSVSPPVSVGPRPRKRRESASLRTCPVLFLKEQSCRAARGGRLVTN